MISPAAAKLEAKQAKFSLTIFFVAATCKDYL